MCKMKRTSNNVRFIRLLRQKEETEYQRNFCHSIEQKREKSYSPRLPGIINGGDVGLIKLLSTSICVPYRLPLIL